MKAPGPRLPTYLAQIVDACAWIEENTRITDEAAFADDRQLRESMLYSLQVIGEASKRVMVYSAFSKKHADVSFVEAAKMRDVLVHQYDGIRMSYVWDTLVNEVPKLKASIENILRTTSAAQFAQWEREKR